MLTQYIKDKTARLYETESGRKWHMVLIFGDEVKTSGTPVNGRLKAEFRGREGYISESDLGSHPALELYFIDVGQGDSTFMVTPGRKRILIDGGVNRRALGFLVWKYRLDKGGPPIDIHLLVLSHADGDHLDGLIPIIQHPKINVKRVIHSGIAMFRPGAFDTQLGDLDATEEYMTTRHDSLADLNGLPLSDSFDSWQKAAVAEGTSYAAVDASTGFLNIGDPAVEVDVLGPRLDKLNGKPVYRWFGDAGKTINGHSLILRLSYKQTSALFSGDLNIKGSKHLLSDPNISTKMDAHVFKAPHHGSHKFHLPFLEAVRPQISVISSGDEPDHGHPRASFIGAVGLASRSNIPLVFSTEIAATFAEDDIVDVDAATSLEGLDFRTAKANETARRVFKRRLNGMINVRTDGKYLYAARRVVAGYWWESYGPIKPASRPSVFGIN